MKKIIFLLLFLPFYSCNDWLDVESEISVTYRNYFQSESDLEKILVTMFGSEKNILAYGGRYLDYVGLPCDYPSTYTKPYQELNYETFWSKGCDNFMSWSTYYATIYMANFLRDNQYRIKNIPKERVNYWMAQANFIKGLMYFKIAQHWGEAPIAPGSEEADERAQSPVDTVLAEAIRCAKAALILPPHDKLTDANGAAITSRQYASLGSVHTLLANIYAWMGGLYDKEEFWKKAEQEASLVIEGKAGFYDLENNISLLIQNTLGKARATKEVIFSIEVNEQDDRWYDIANLELRYPGTLLINYPYTETDPRKINNALREERISVNAVKQLFPDPEDQRRKEYWYKLGEELTIEGEETPFKPRFAYINKWRDAVKTTNPVFIMQNIGVIAMDGNRIIWRLADLILLRAECRAHLGMTTEALKDLDRIRDRAGLKGYTGATNKTSLLKEIFHERERELFGEGERYFDIVRNGYFREELKGNYKTLSEQDVKDGALYLRIHNNAFTKNPLMKQNLFWLWHQN